MPDDEAMAMPRKGSHPWGVEGDDIESDGLSDDEFLTDDDEAEEPEDAPPYYPGVDLCIVRTMRY